MKEVKVMPIKTICPMKLQEVSNQPKFELDDEKIIIYVDGDGVVHAKYINKTKGICVITKATPQKGDKFNFFTGVQVAIQKLIVKMKVKCKMVLPKQFLDKWYQDLEVI